MRKLVWLLILLAALWGAWWAVATAQMQSALSRLLDARRAAGWEVALDDITKAGFPLKLQNTLTGLSLADPAQGFQLKAAKTTLSAPLWWPGNLSLDTPRLHLDTAAGPLPLEVTAQDVAGRLFLSPGFALELEQLSLHSAALELEGPDGPLLEIAQPRAEMRHLSDQPMTYRLHILPDAITPGPLLRRLFSEDGPPPSAPSLAVEAEITLDHPLNRQLAKRGSAPRVQQIDLTGARIAWGDIGLAANGTVTVDAAGQPEGALTLKVQNWERLVNIAQRAGLLPPAMRLQVETMLRALENRGDVPGGLDLELVFTDGQMTLAGIPLGPAPRLPRAD